MTEKDEMLDLEYLNFLYKTSLKTSITRDTDQIKTFPIGDSLPEDVKLKYYKDDYELVNGTNFGGTLGYPMSSFTNLNLVDSTNSQTYPNINDVLPPNLIKDQNLGNSYCYQEGTIGGYRLAQIAPGGFIRDTANIRHYHRLILSPIDNLGSTNPIDTTNRTLINRTYDFSAFDRNGENILKNCIPPNFSGFTDVGTEEITKNVEHYSIYLGTLGYSLNQFYNTDITPVQNEISLDDFGNWTFDFRKGIIHFNNLPSNGDTESDFLNNFPPVLSFFKYIGPPDLLNLVNTDIDTVIERGCVNCVNTIYNNTSYKIFGNSFSDLNIYNIVKSSSCLISVSVFETNTEYHDKCIYLGKYLSKEGIIRSTEQETNTSANFKGSFITNTGDLRVTNTGGDKITLTVIIKTREII